MVWSGDPVSDIFDPRYPEPARHVAVGGSLDLSDPYTLIDLKPSAQLFQHAKHGLGVHDVYDIIKGEIRFLFKHLSYALDSTLPLSSISTMEMRFRGAMRHLANTRRHQ